MDFKLISSQLSNNQNNSRPLSDELFEEISPLSEINRGKGDTLKLSSTGFQVIDPTEMVINKLVVSDQQYQREPYNREYKNQELDPEPADSIEENLESYRKKWGLRLGFLSFFIPGSGQGICKRLIHAFIFLLLAVLCIAASYLLTYKVLAGLIIIGIVSGIDEYRTIKKFNYLPDFKKFWVFPLVFLIIYAIGIYLVLKGTFV